MRPRDVIRRIDEIEGLIEHQVTVDPSLEALLGDALDELRAWREEMERQELADCFVGDRRAA
ncbi:MAG: hypothetical protein ABSD47_01270 [Candidatus Methylomirabilota bacterium]|jgi:hypothetical protein